MELRSGTQLVCCCTRVILASPVEPQVTYSADCSGLLLTEDEVPLSESQELFDFSHRSIDIFVTVRLQVHVPRASTAESALSNDHCLVLRPRGLVTRLNQPAVKSPPQS